MTLEPCSCSAVDNVNLNLTDICEYLKNKKEGERRDRKGELVLTIERYTVEQLEMVCFHRVLTDET